jgi:hypothetical protein
LRDELSQRRLASKLQHNERGLTSPFLHPQLFDASKRRSPENESWVKTMSFE